MIADAGGRVPSAVAPRITADADNRRRDAPQAEPCLSVSSSPHDASLIVIFVGLWLAVVATVMPVLLCGSPTADVTAHRNTLDPNTAPWWELAILPRIGRRTAQQIDQYRRAVAGSATNGHGAFGCAADLDQVPGIGPVTVQRIAPYLRFEPPARRSADGS